MPRDLPSPRRSRRANGSSTTSKSPDAEDEPANSNGRNKRLKHEDDDEEEDSPPAPPARGGRRKKDRDVEPEPSAQDDGDDDGGGDEEGTTRCLCDELEVDGGDFMVMCEECSVWQHGVCMGLNSESDVPDQYFCEQCRPDLHTKAIQAWQAKRRERSGRQSSTTNGHTRHSRSHSPTVTMKQPSKRRNTMNSRDADFDEITKQILEESAAEAAAFDTHHPGHSSKDQDEDEAGPKRKRRRPDDDAPPPSAKRTRSGSAASEHLLSASGARGETPSATVENRKQSVPILGPPPKGHGGRGGKRGGARKAVANEPGPTPEQEDHITPNPDSTSMPAPPAPPLSKRGGWGGRGRGGNRKAPVSHAASAAPKSTTNGTGTQTIDSAPKANKNSHAYVVSQQSLYTSWNLPDYLAHLQPLLPADAPVPLEVHGSTGVGDHEKSTERGVKVKWPAKRTSVVDMNKRVRALVEWVGREQNNLMAREKRKKALEEAVEKSNSMALAPLPDAMLVDGELPGPLSLPIEASSVASKPPDLQPSTGSMKLMEELMEELLAFQDKYGRGRT